MATETSVGVINQTGSAAVQVDAVAITIPAATPAAATTNYRQAIVVADPVDPLGFAPVDPVLGLTIFADQLAEANVVLRLMLTELQAQTALLGGVSPTA